jgi:hypothetical protein
MDAAVYSLAMVETLRATSLQILYIYLIIPPNLGGRQEQDYFKLTRMGQSPGFADSQVESPVRATNQILFLNRKRGIPKRQDARTGLKRRLCHSPGRCPGLRLVRPFRGLRPLAKISRLFTGPSIVLLRAISRMTITKGLSNLIHSLEMWIRAELRIIFHICRLDCRRRSKRAPILPE